MAVGWVSLVQAEIGTVGDLQTGRDRARQGLAASWGGSLLHGVASGVGISFKAWSWGGSLVGGGEVLVLQQKTQKAERAKREERAERRESK